MKKVDECPKCGLAVGDLLDMDNGTFRMERAAVVEIGAPDPLFSCSVVVFGQFIHKAEGWAGVMKNHAGYRCLCDGYAAWRKKKVSRQLELFERKWP